MDKSISLLKREKEQGNAAAEGEKAEEEGNGDVERLELVRAAAGPVGVAVALLGMRGERRGNVRFVDLRDEPFMEGEGQVDERHGLEDQVQEGGAAREGAVL